MARYKQIIIMYHIEERDLVLYQMMEESIQEIGLADEIIVVKEMDAFERIYDYCPDLIISIYPKNELSAELFTLVKYIYDCAFVAIPAEQYVPLSANMLYIAIGYNSLPRMLIDKCLFWGPKTAECIGTYLVENNRLSSIERIGIYGYLPYEKDRIRKYYNKSELIDKIHCMQKEYRRTIMFANGIMSNSVTMDDVIAEGVVDPKDSTTYEHAVAELKCKEYYSDKYVEAIVQVANGLSDTLVLVKIHPNEKYYVKNAGQSRYSKFEGISNIVIIDEANPISQYFDNIDFFIHYGSTSSLEAFVYGIPVIFLVNDYDIVVENSYGDSNGKGDYEIKVSDYQGLVRCILEMNDYSKSESLKEQAFDIMNYRNECDYHPSKLFAEHIKELGDPQMLIYSDPEVRKTLKGKYARHYIHHYIADMIRSLFVADFSRTKRITKMLIRYKQKKRIK